MKANTICSPKKRITEHSKDVNHRRKLLYTCYNIKSLGNEKFLIFVNIEIFGTTETNYHINFNI